MSFPNCQELLILAALRNYSQSVWMDNIWKSAHSVYPQLRNKCLLLLITEMKGLSFMPFCCWFILAGKKIVWDSFILMFMKIKF